MEQASSHHGNPGCLVEWSTLAVRTTSYLAYTCIYPQFVTFLTLMNCHVFYHKAAVGFTGWTAVHCCVLHCAAAQCTALHCAAVQCTALHCAAVQCTALHCAAVLCTVLQSSALCSTGTKWRLGGEGEGAEVTIPSNWPQNSRQFRSNHPLALLRIHCWFLVSLFLNSGLHNLQRHLMMDKWTSLTWNRLSETFVLSFSWPSW